MTNRDTYLNQAADAAAVSRRKSWTTPRIEMLDIDLAAGSQFGSLCDKFGSLSASQGHDRCNPATK